MMTGGKGGVSIPPKVMTSFMNSPYLMTSDEIIVLTFCVYQEHLAIGRSRKRRGRDRGGRGAFSAYDDRRPVSG